MGYAELTDQDIAAKAHQTERDLVAARFKHSTNQLENTAELRVLRREIARLQSEARRREITSGQAKGSIFASYRPTEGDAPVAESTEAKGGFLQGLVDKISGTE